MLKVKESKETIIREFNKKYPVGSRITAKTITAHVSGTITIISNSDGVFKLDSGRSVNIEDVV